MNKLIIQTATVLIATLLFASVAYAERAAAQENGVVFHTHPNEPRSYGSLNLKKMNETTLSRPSENTTP